MFLSILDDRRIRDNLLIVWADPSARPPYDPEYYDEIHSANWYARTHAAMQTRGSSAVLCGLILFIDRTFTAENDRLGCECVFFTLTIVPRALRNQPYAWRPLGMLPKFDSNSKKGQNATAYHSCLKEILSGLISVQQVGSITESVLRKDKMPTSLKDDSKDGSDRSQDG
jgi:hypothetical protein